MNRRQFLSLAVASSWIGVLPCANAKPASGMIWHPEPRPVPSLNFLDASEKPLRLTDFPGRVVVLNFWASWCLPCLVELPSLDKLKGDVDPRRVAVLAVSADLKGLPVAKAAFERLGIQHLDLLLDGDKDAASLLAIPFLPATLLIDANGREIGRFMGAADWGSPQVAKILDALSAGRPVPSGQTIPAVPLPAVAP